MKRTAIYLTLANILISVAISTAITIPFAIELNKTRQQNSQLQKQIADLNIQLYMDGAQYVAYCGNWTILHIKDIYRHNPTVDFYLAYNIYTHETVTAINYTQLLKQLE